MYQIFALMAGFVTAVAVTDGSRVGQWWLLGALISFTVPIVYFFDRQRIHPQGLMEYYLLGVFLWPLMKLYSFIDAHGWQILAVIATAMGVGALGYAIQRVRKKLSPPGEERHYYSAGEE